MHKWMGLAAATGAAAASCMIRSEYEKKHFLVEEYPVCSDKLKKSRKFVFLSDLHNNSFGPHNRELLEAIRRIKPDGILIGGDMMVCKGREDMRIATELVRNLSSCYPVYYGNGNHETRMRDERRIYGDQYDRFVDLLNREGVVYLNDRSVLVDDDIRITGMDLEQRFYKKIKVPAMTAADVRKHVGRAPGNRFQILLAHSPLFFDAYSSWGSDLTLAGHFHGGTIRLPVLGGVMTPQYQFFLPWCAGAFTKERKQMIVSRGLGTHSINIRFNNRPQVVVIKLIPVSTDGLSGQRKQ